VSYFGQALGLIVAKSRIIALEAVKKVRVEYVNVEGPVVDVFEAYQKAEKEEMLEKQIVGSYKSRPNTDVDVEHEIEGEWRIGGQYHFHMELQNCLCIPTADGLDVYSGTQVFPKLNKNLHRIDLIYNTFLSSGWIMFRTFYQVYLRFRRISKNNLRLFICETLVITVNMTNIIRYSSINVHVKRLGGGFGGKLTRPAQIAAACAVAAYTIRKPVRVQLDLETNMSLVGKRAPFYMKYKVAKTISTRTVNLVR
jgi:xanthine dehydrogenase/oxidase